ncbi:uncharacterized protein PFL1_06617 [Pseudozyma flocculosa PF-1]|uniref:Uncharacterized protein n=2 Tax=Pseudozyma flocculosa TaxID=84751 RepID=A0A5C3FA70_9BASI|nr:uncharacterized protein PFL1_06617 [Pseudozyma flocculosa PF-1]EPQ25750.1 hypothetical protein PFL1_06617 [Pseudozyma flocculosa PF-1]SPO40555.1 uncharacterized protein PSFLO_06037 [Pseudozyma flocculosa]
MSSADPAEDCLYLAIAYKPNKIANMVAGIVYALLGFAFVWRWATTMRARWSLWLPIGCFASAAGFFMRTQVDPCDFNIPIYAVSQMLVLVSPCAFIAFNYMLYKRIVLAADPECAAAAVSTTKKGGNTIKKKHVKSRFSFMPPLIAGRLFVCSDLITFLIQSYGGGMTAQEKTVDIGNKLFLIGVTCQACVYGLYILAFTVLAYRLNKYRVSDLATGEKIQWRTSLRSLIVLTYISSVFVMIRSVFRVVEFVQGHQGELVTHEVYLFVLDVLPLVIAVFVWLCIWPIHNINHLADECHSTQHEQLPFENRPFKHSGSY